MNVICWKQNAMKLVRTVWSCWVKSIHHSFVGWTGIQRSCPQLPSSPRRIDLRAVVRRKPTVADGFPEKSAWGETPLHFAAHNGHVAAAELLLSKGAAVDAKNKFGRGLNPGRMRQKSRSRTWGTSKYFFVLEILRNMFAFSVNPKHACSDGRGLKGGSRARNRVSPTWGTSRIFLGWKFCVAALLAENWWSSY